MIQIAIADDHAIVRTGLKQILSMTPDMTVIVEAESAAQLVEGLQGKHVDILLLDLNMPGASGAEMVTDIRSKWPELPILVLSMHNEPPIVASVLRAGANGYVTKDSDLSTLLPAVRRVANRGTYLAHGLAEKIVFYEAKNSRQSPLLQFTNREKQIFLLLLRGQSILNIAEQLFISNKTVSTHKVRILRKVKCKTMADLMIYAMKHQLID